MQVVVGAVVGARGPGVAYGADHVALSDDVTHCQALGVRSHVKIFVGDVVLCGFEGPTVASARGHSTINVLVCEPAGDYGVEVGAGRTRDVEAIVGTLAA